MLRNIISSKVVTGPLNSCKDKIVTVLNPEVKLALANTKIK